MQNTIAQIDIHIVDMVMVSGNKIVTTSLKVAEAFGKQHKHVLRAIKNLSCSANGMVAPT